MIDPVRVVYIWSDGAESVTTVPAATLPFRPYAAAFPDVFPGMALVGIEEAP